MFVKPVDRTPPVGCGWLWRNPPAHACRPMIAHVADVVTCQNTTAPTQHKHRPPRPQPPQHLPHGGRSLWKRIERLTHGTDAFSGRIAGCFRHMAVRTWSRSVGAGMTDLLLTAGEHAGTINQTSGMHNRCPHGRSPFDT